MFEITSKMIKTWSTVGQRATLGLVLFELAKSNKELFVVTSDVSTSAGLDRFRKTYTDQFVDVGIAEQNMIGVAAGIATNGFDVVTTTFAPFQSLRCCEQIKVNLAYTNTKTIMVGLASGLVNGPLGNTHCCIEDIGALRSIPNLKLISPADGLGLAKALFGCLEQDSPAYIRLTGGANNPVIYSQDSVFKIGQANELKFGDDITIFATGTMVAQSLIVAEKLAEHNVSASVWDMHTIKPIDKLALRKAALNTPLIVSIEEHNIFGGLSSAIAENICAYKNPPQLLAIGIEDSFLEPGSYEHMLHQAGLTPDSITDKILNALKLSLH